ncbi:MAG: hypothetical protein HY390_02775 [Deltaproteobacteria bacterium]|nr:hypothetical protein [Deltaproteobacteria bacterium]
MKRVVVVLTIFMGSLCWSLSFADPVLQSLLEKNIEQLLMLFRREAVHLGHLPWASSVEQNLSGQIARQWRNQMQTLALKDQTRFLQEHLSAGELSKAIRSLESAPAEREVILAVLAESKSAFQLARKAMVLQMEQVALTVSEQMPGGWFSLWEHIKMIRSQGHKTDPNKIIWNLLSQGEDVSVWGRSLSERVAVGERVEIEELMAFESLLEPINDLVFSEAIESIYFRRALVIEFWKQMPAEFHYFCDRIAFILFGRLHSELLPSFMAEFPATAFRALSPDRRSAAFWHGFSTSYAKDRVEHLAQVHYFRLMNFLALERIGFFPSGEYREFLRTNLEHFGEQWFFQRWPHTFKRWNLQFQLREYEKYQKAFREGPIDIFSDSFGAAQFFDDSFLNGLRKWERFGWWMSNTGRLMVTSLMGCMFYYIVTRPEEIPNPQVQWDTGVFDPDNIIKNIDSKMHILRLRLELEKDPQKRIELLEDLEKSEQNKSYWKTQQGH